MGYHFERPVGGYRVFLNILLTYLPSEFNIVVCEVCFYEKYNICPDVYVSFACLFLQCNGL